MEEAFVGTILIWPLDWAPEGWLLCQGQTLPIASNQALFALIGTKYGGDGVNNFKIPNLAGRIPLGDNDQYTLGQQIGAASASVAVTTNNLPNHSHTATFTSGTGTPTNVSVAIPAVGNANAADPNPGNTASLASVVTGSPDPVGVYSTAATNTTLKPFNISFTPTVSGSVTVAAGGGIASPVPLTVPTVPPSLVLNFIICLYGVYPIRP